MEHEPEHELERLVSKDGDDATLAFDNAGASTHRKLVVLFDLVYPNPLILNPVKFKAITTLFVLPRDTSIAGAVDYAISHFPEGHREPDFSEVLVYYSEGMRSASLIQLLDLSPDLCTVFGDADILVIRNDLEYDHKSGILFSKLVCLFLVGFPAFIFLVVWILTTLSG